MRRNLVYAAAVIALAHGTTAWSGKKFSDWCQPVSLGPVVNSPSSDGGPAISKDGLSLYFHSNRSGNFDLYVSQRASEQDPWGPPQNLGPVINTPGVDTVPALSRDGHWLFFNSLNRPGGYGGFDLWAAYRADVHDDFAWGVPFNLGPGVNSAAADVGATYFENDVADGEGNDFGTPLLFFGSTKLGGPGRMDIYVSALQPDGTFGPAQLIAELSSPANEVRPSIRSDGLEIFLTRDVDAVTTNDNDIYVATRASVSDPWSAPVKLGTNINTAVDDIRAYISSDRTELYFESGPNEPLGNMDIYVATRSRTGECGAAQ